MPVSESLSGNKVDTDTDVLRILISIFSVVCVASGAYVVNSIFLEEKKFFKKESEEGISAVLEQAPSFIERKHEEYSQFLRQIQSRDIFMPTQIEKTVSASGDELEKIKKIIEGLRLVGIKSGAVPKVIIEDSQSKKTFYLKEGDSFAENIIVEKIGRDSVILNAAGESFELYL